MTLPARLVINRLRQRQRLSSETEGAQELKRTGELGETLEVVMPRAVIEMEIPRAGDAEV